MSINTILVDILTCYSKWSAEWKNIKFILTLDSNHLNNKNKLFLDKITYNKVYFSGLNDYQLKKFVDIEIDKLKDVYFNIDVKYVRNFILNSRSKWNIREVKKTLEEIHNLNSWVQNSNISTFISKKELCFESYYFCYYIYNFIILNSKIGIKDNESYFFKKIMKYLKLDLTYSEEFEENETHKNKRELEEWFETGFYKWEDLRNFLEKFQEIKKELNYIYNEILCRLIFKYFKGDIIDIQKSSLFEFDWNLFFRSYSYNDYKNHILYKVDINILDKRQEELLDYFNYEFKGIIDSNSNDNISYFSNMILFIADKKLIDDNFSSFLHNKAVLTSLINSCTILSEKQKEQLLEITNDKIKKIMDFIFNTYDNWEKLSNTLIKEFDEENKNTQFTNRTKVQDSYVNSNTVFKINMPSNNMNDYDIEYGICLLKDRIVNDIDKNILENLFKLWKLSKLKSCGEKEHKATAYIHEILFVRTFLEEIASKTSFQDKVLELKELNKFSDKLIN